MFVTLATATGATPRFSWSNLIILLVIAAVFYPLQKKLRESVSRRRKERWAQEDSQAQEKLRLRDQQDAGRPPGRPAGPSPEGTSSPTDTTDSPTDPSTGPEERA